MSSLTKAQPRFRGAGAAVAVAVGALVLTSTITSAEAASTPNAVAGSPLAPAATALPTPPSTTPPSTPPRATPKPIPKPRCKPRKQMAVPRGKAAGNGQRIIYSQRRQHVWVLDRNNCTIRDYAVTGRADWPKAGAYKVFSKSRSSSSVKYGVTFNYMIRFARGRTTAIGFHDIPKKNGRPIQRVSSLGQPLGLGGCVRAAPANAKWLYGWAKVGTRVYVVR